MRFFSIAVFTGLVAASHVAAYNFEARDSHLQSRNDDDDNNCDPGEGFNTSKKKCDDCSAGTFSGGGFKVQCQPCAAGYISGKEASSCSACPAGRYSTDGKTCNTCPNGSTSSAGSSFCSCSAAGSYWNNGSCKTCAAGYYSSPGATSCTTCAANTYSTGGAGTCTPCPPNKVSSPGSTSSSQCVSSCPAGQVTGAGGCSNCAAGTYSNNNVCTDCSPGMVSNPGSANCTPCPGGQVPASNGRTCSPCQANTFSNGDICTPCPAGYTSSAGSSSCGPQPSNPPRPPRSASQMCQGAGFMRCDVLSGKGGSECINIMTTLDSCGGCVGPEGEEYKYSGRDCSAIKNVSEVKCQAGRCNITSCRKGYEPEDGSCVPSAGSVKRGAAHGSRNVKRGLSARHDSF